MAKNIVVFSDGTGNSAIKNRGTNVFKMFEAVDTQLDQVVIYDDGVGTEDLKFLRIIGGCLGVGLSRNVRQLYASIVRVYEPDDKIFLFGFSRGAFTVRFLAGLIDAIGIIDNSKCDIAVKKGSDSAQPIISSDAELKARVYQGFREYRDANRALLEKVYGPIINLFYLILGLLRLSTKYYRTQGQKEFSNAFCHTDASSQNPIMMIGVWDTVCAVGLPFTTVADFVNKNIYHFTFSDRSLSKNIKYGFHALSIDDQRRTFSPYLWDETEKHNKQTIEQVWFSGVHANVGGGYNKQGMSLVALDWMIGKAQLNDKEDNGIHFIEDDILHFKTHKNVNDKLYDSRSGFSFFYRYTPRDIHKLCQIHDVKPKIHNSVIQRIQQRTEGYAPGNIPKNFTVVNSSEKPAIQATEYDGDIPVKKTSLLDDVRYWIWVRRIMSWSIIGTVVYAFVRSLGSYTGNILSSDLLIHVALNQPLLVYLGILLFYVIASIGKQKMRRKFSEFWHKLLQNDGNRLRKWAMP